jgi:pyruvate kinase
VGWLSTTKGVNFPGVYLSIKAMTIKDRRGFNVWLGSKGVDWVALSFVHVPRRC